MDGNDWVNCHNKEIIQLAKKAERDRWAAFIGNELATEHPKHRAAFWGIAEMMQNNNMNSPKLGG